MAAFALSYAEQNARDHAQLVTAIADGRRRQRAGLVTTAGR